LGKSAFKQILVALERQLLFGKTYLPIARGLTEAEPIVFGVAPTFFGLTIEGDREKK
jgi:hypothetical protein